MKLGIIGTNWITGQFVDAALETTHYQLHSIYSRREESGKKFGEPYQVTNIYTDLTAFFADKELEVVYIASPNSLHYAQAKQAIENGKHVIVEKPAVSTSRELEELLQLAEQKQVLYFEAARNIHEENFGKVGQLVLEMKEDIVAANFSFMKYSSRFDQVLAGEEPNIFSPKFSGGALMDLGIYLVYAAIAWFGKPDEVHYFAKKLPTGVDGTGHIIFRYPNFDVNMMTGKTSTSFMPSEIIGHQQTLLLDAVNSIESVKVYEHATNETRSIPMTKEDNPMVEEANHFARMIAQPSDYKEEYQRLLGITKDVHQVMEEMRKQAGIIFPADNEK